MVNFDSSEQLNKCAKEWIEVLGLSDWCVTCVLAEYESDDSGDLELGHNDYDFCNKTSVITIYKTPKSDFFNVFQEETLIHELLHCKFPIEYVEGDYYSKRCADLQHQVLNDMARALFMTKYGWSMRDYKKQVIKRRK